MTHQSAIVAAVPTLAFRKLATFFNEAERSGVKCSEMLRAARISPKVLGDSAGVSFELFGRMMNLLAKRAPPEFGVQMGMRWDFTKFGLIGYSLLSSRDFGHFADRCLANIQRFAHMKVISQVDGGYWVLRYGVRAPMSPLAGRLCFEEACGAVAAIWRTLTGEDFGAEAIEFTYADSERDVIIAAHLGVAVRSGCRENRVILKRTDRNLLLVIGERDTLRLCKRSCSGILPEFVGGPSLLVRLRELLLLSFGRPPKLDDVADAMGMGKRTLNRVLEQHGTDYRSISRKYRMDFSMELLRSRELCVKEIAFALGFSSTTSFRRTFHKWTGCTAGDWTRVETGALPPRR